MSQGNRKLLWGVALQDEGLDSAQPNELVSDMGHDETLHEWSGSMETVDEELFEGGLQSEWLGRRGLNLVILLAVWVLAESLHTLHDLLS